MSLIIGILAAVDEEIQPLIDKLQQPQRIERARFQFYTGKLDQQETVLVRSGVCKVNAAAAVQQLIDVFHADIVLMGGAAGAIDRTLHIGDTVVLEQCAYHDVDNNDVLVEYFPYMKDCWFYADARLLACARRAAETARSHVVFGRGVSGEAFIDQQGRETIEENFRPLCVDMESAAAAHVCYLNQIPFLAVRTISDTPEESGLEVYHENADSVSMAACEMIRLTVQQLNFGELSGTA